MIGRCHLLLAGTALWSPFVLANDNAGVFFYGVPPTPAEIAALAPTANVTAITKGNLTTVAVQWADVSLTINIDPAWDRAVQLSGIRGWLGGFPENERTSKAVTSFFGALDRTTTCYGSVISPGYDKDGKVASLLKKLLGSAGGFFFSHQSFYSAAGTRIVGLPGDPATLGPR